MMTIGFDLPEVSPFPGLSSPVLGDGMRLPKTSMAEYILSLHHEHLLKHQPGLPIGETDQKKIFDFYWDKLLDLGFEHKLLPLYQEEGYSAYISLHTDGSALLWKRFSPERWAPCPVPLSIDLPATPDQALHAICNKRMMQTHTRSMTFDQIIHKSRGSQSTWHPSTWSGSIHLHAALKHEARQWIAWMNEAPQVFKLPVWGQEAAPGVVLPWCHSIKTATGDDLLYMRDLLYFFAKEITEQLGIVDAPSFYISVMLPAINYRASYSDAGC